MINDILANYSRIISIQKSKEFNENYYLNKNINLLGISQNLSFFSLFMNLDSANKKIEHKIEH